MSDEPTKVGDWTIFIHPSTDPPRYEAEIVPKQITTRKPCEVHGHHQPQPQSNDIHHVWPLGHGGPDTKANQIIACPTGHRNIHELLRQLILLDGKVPYSVRRTFGLKEREYAQLGYERIKRKAM